MVYSRLVLSVLTLVHYSTLVVTVFCSGCNMNIFESRVKLFEGAILFTLRLTGNVSRTVANVI